MKKKKKGQRPVFTFPLTKEVFIRCIDAIRKQIEHDRKCTQAFEVIMPHRHMTGYDNNTLYSQLIELRTTAYGNFFFYVSRRWKYLTCQIY